MYLFLGSLMPLESNFSIEIVKSHLHVYRLIPTAYWFVYSQNFATTASLKLTLSIVPLPHPVTVILRPVPLCATILEFKTSYA